MEDSINVSVLIRLPSFYDITPATGFFNFLAVDVESRVAPGDTESRLLYFMALIISEVGREYPDKIIVKNFNVPYIKEHHAARRKIDRWEQAARAKNVVAVWHVKYKK